MISTPDYLNARDALAFSRRGATQSQLISNCFVDRPGDDTQSVFDRIRVRVGARAPFIPRLTQRIVATPWGLAPPAWFDAELFDLDYHVQLKRVSGGGIPELMRVIEDIMDPLDLRRPPWRIYAVDGFDDGTWAFVVQVHHAIGDGAACIALFGAVLFDLDFVVPPEAARPKVFAPPKLRLVAPGLAWRGRAVAQRFRNTLGVIRSGSQVKAFAHDLKRLAKLLWRESRQPYRPAGINRPPSGEWICRLTTRPLDEVRALARSTEGATVNTVYLSAVAHAIGEALRAEGMPLQAPLKIGVPKNLRQDTNRVFVDSSTQTGNLVVTAPLAQQDPRELMRVITQRLREALDCDEPAVRAMLGKGGAVQKWPLRWNVTATLVHGPPGIPCSLGGGVERWLLTALPGGTKGLGLIGMAYNGKLTIFVVADRSLAAIADGVCAGIQVWFDSLSGSKRDVTVAIPDGGLRSAVAVAR
jgi:hypothetical protein